MYVPMITLLLLNGLTMIDVELKITLGCLHISRLLGVILEVIMHTLRHVRRNLMSLSWTITLPSPDQSSALATGWPVVFPGELPRA